MSDDAPLDPISPEPVAPGIGTPSAPTETATQTQAPPVASTPTEPAPSTPTAETPTQPVAGTTPPGPPPWGQPPGGSDTPAAPRSSTVAVPKWLVGVLGRARRRADRLRRRLRRRPWWQRLEHPVPWRPEQPVRRQRRREPQPRRERWPEPEWQRERQWQWEREWWSAADDPGPGQPVGRVPRRGEHQLDRPERCARHSGRARLARVGRRPQGRRRDHEGRRCRGHDAGGARAADPEPRFG